MAIEKVIKIDVQSDDLDHLNNQLDKTEQNFKEVDKAAGKTSNQVEEVTKNGGAIAILDQLTGGLATRFRDAFEATRLFNVSLKGTRTALIATGIGAFVVALGVVVSYWDEISDFISGYSRKLQENIDLGRIRATQLDAELGLLDKQAELNTLEGKSNVEILKLKKQKLELLNLENIAIIENLTLQLEQEQSKAREVTLWEKIKIAAASRFDSDLASRAIVSSLNDNTELAIELQKQLNEAKGKQFDIEIAIAKSKGLGGDSEDLSPRERAEILNIGTTASIQQEVFDDSIDAIEAYSKRKVSIEKTSAEASKEIARLEREDKEKQLTLIGNALGALGNLIGQETGAGKALAGASALVSTYLAAQQAYASQFLPVPTATSPFRAALAAGVAVASGLANVKAIMAVKVPGNYGGSGVAGSPTVAATPPQAPDFNVVGASDTNQLEATLSSKNNVVKAYVVSKDVSTAQELDRNTLDTASFG